MHALARMLLGLLTATVTACSPVNFSINLGPDRQPLHATTVLRDPGADGKVALIDLTGLIADIEEPALLSRGENPVDEFLARLRKAEEDSSIKAVVIRINSPGGTVVASDLLYEEIIRFREVTGKPVVASFAEVAASGGYYIALAADEIVSQPSTITGSVGVILQTFNVSEGLNRLGIRSRAVTSGPNKALANPLEQPEEAHYEILQGLVDEMYGAFRGRVIERRPRLRPESIDMATDGRVFTGTQALQLGLVDSLGGVRDAFERAKTLAGLEKGSLVKFHEPGMKPRTPYASGPGLIPTTGTEINLVQLRLDAAALHALGPGACYLWMP